MSKKDALLVCIREQARYSQTESLFYLSVLRGVQPYAADEKMLTPLFFCMPSTIQIISVVGSQHIKFFKQ